MFGQNTAALRLCVLLFSSHREGGPVVFVCSSVGDVSFDHLVQVVSAMFFHCEVIFFPL